MTLAQFLKLFDFDKYNIEIYTVFASEETYSGIYISKMAIECDFCIYAYDVIEIRPLTETTLQIVIRH